MIVFLLFSLTGCNTKAQFSEKELPKVTIKVNGQTLVYNVVDVSKDTLISKKVDEDVDFSVEKSIFLPLIQNSKTKVYANIGDTIEITFNNLPDSAELYDHLLNEDGKSYFNRSIVKHKIPLDKKIVGIDFAQHSSLALASSSNILEKDLIRGFRLVTKTGNNTSEYAFIIYTNSK